MFFWRKKREHACTSGNWKNKATEVLPLVAGIGLTVLAILVARHRISSVEKDILEKNAPVEIVVAAVSIPAGESFSSENIAKKPVPSTGTSRRNIPASEYELILGEKAKVEISAGEPVCWTDVEEPFEIEKFSLTIPKGQRAFSIEADAQASFSGLIRPGDRVDILCEAGSGRGFRSLLLDVPVIAVDRNYLPHSDSDEGNGIGALTLSIAPDDAIRLSAASREGRIFWLLRNPEDHGRPSGIPRRGSESTHLIELWKGGIREVYPPVSTLNGQF